MMLGARTLDALAGLRARSARAARALGLLGAGLLALGGSLALPRAGSKAPGRPPLCALVIDASAPSARRASARTLQLRELLREEASAAEQRGEELVLVLAGADVERSFGPAPARELLALLAGAGEGAPRLRFDPPADLGHELARALELVERELAGSGRPPGRLLLVGDASYSGADPSPLLARLARAGVVIEGRPGPSIDLPDLALVELRTPLRPVEGEPTAATALLELDLGALARLPEGASAQLVLALDSSAGARRFELGLDPPRSGGAFRAELQLGPAAPGRSLLRARVELRAPGALRRGDPCPENDALSAVLTSSGARLAAAVAEADALPALRAWLAGGAAFAGFDWIFLTPAELPARIGELELVLSFDLGHEDLSADALRWHVERGGGWLFCGGWALLRGADPASRGALASLLPLDFARDPSEQRDVVLLVDGSGSMAGEPFEHVKRALVELVEAAPPGDRLTLRLFTASLGPPIELGGASAPERRANLARLLRAQVPGGPTAILDSLEALVAERARQGGPALLLLLSDGHDRFAFDLEGRAQALREALAAQRCELAVIAVGTQANERLLGSLLAPGRELAIATDLRELGELFQREVQRGRLREGQALAIEPALPESAGELEPAAEILRAARRRPSAEWPRAQRYVRAELRPGASPLWLGEEGEVVLALQRVGAGLVAAWASAPLPGWSEEFAAARDLVGPLLRGLAEGARRAGGPQLAIEGGRLLLHGADLSWPAVLEAQAFAPALAGAFEGSGAEVELGTLRLELPAEAVGKDPRLWRVAADLRPLLRAPAGMPLRIAIRHPGTGTVLDQLGLAAPRPLVLEPGPRPRWRLPGTLPAQAEGAAERGRAPSPLAPWVLGAGLLVLALGAVAGSGRDARARSDAAGSGSAPLRSKTMP